MFMPGFFGMFNGFGMNFNLGGGNPNNGNNGNNGNGVFNNSYVKYIIMGIFFIPFIV